MSTSRSFVTLNAPGTMFAEMPASPYGLAAKKKGGPAWHFVGGEGATRVYGCVVYRTNEGGVSFSKSGKVLLNLPVLISGLEQTQQRIRTDTQES
jgi:hypothetical protein